MGKGKRTIKFNFTGTKGIPTEGSANVIGPPRGKPRKKLSSRNNLDNESSLGVRTRKDSKGRMFFS